jgi:hypothetical protein
MMINKEIARRRMRSQRIAWVKERSPYDVVRRLGAVQAQEYTQALWAIGLRMRNGSVEEIEKAVADRRVVLTWAMRGTLHFVPAEDMEWMIRLLAPRVLAKDTRRLEQLNIDPRQMALCEKTIGDALKERKRITRPNLMKLLEDAGFATQNQRGYHVLWYLAQTGLLCLGPMEGKQQTFVLAEDWIRERKALSKEESLRELAVRYFTGHGPATLQDFAWWSGLTVAEARSGLESAHGVLTAEKIGGTEYWMGPEEAAGHAEDPVVSLLPGYDEYILGYKDRSAVLEPDCAPLIVRGSNGVLAPMLVVDGRVAGTWTRTAKKSGVDIAIHPFAIQPLDASGIGEKQAVEAARRYAEFVRLPLSQVQIAAEEKV